MSELTGEQDGQQQEEESGSVDQLENGGQVEVVPAGENQLEGGRQEDAQHVVAGEPSSRPDPGRNFILNEPNSPGILDVQPSLRSLLFCLGHIEPFLHLVFQEEVDAEEVEGVEEEVEEGEQEVEEVEQEVEEIEPEVEEVEEEVEEVEEEVKENEDNTNEQDQNDEDGMLDNLTASLRKVFKFFWTGDQITAQLALDLRQLYPTQINAQSIERDVLLQLIRGVLIRLNQDGTLLEHIAGRMFGFLETITVATHCGCTLPTPNEANRRIKEIITLDQNDSQRSDSRDTTQALLDGYFGTVLPGCLDCRGGMSALTIEDPGKVLVFHMRHETRVIGTYNIDYSLSVTLPSGKRYHFAAVITRTADGSYFCNCRHPVTGTWTCYSSADNQVTTQNAAPETTKRGVVETVVFYVLDFFGIRPISDISPEVDLPSNHSAVAALKVFLTIPSVKSWWLKMSTIRLNWVNLDWRSDENQDDTVCLYSENPSTGSPNALATCRVSKKIGFKDTNIQFLQREFQLIHDRGIGFWAAYKRGQEILQVNMFQTYHTWMEQHSEQLKNLSIFRLAIPGTHDAGSIEDNGDFLTKHGACQDQQIYNQLALGNRAFDLRVSYTSTDPVETQFRLNHWFLKFGPLRQALQEILRFLVVAPKEIIILDLHEFPEWTTGSETAADVHQKLVECIRQELGDKCIPKSIPLTATLDEIWQTNHRIFVNYNHETSRNLNDFPFFPPVEQKWGNRQTAAALKEFMDDLMQKEAGARSRWTKLWGVMCEVTESALSLQTFTILSKGLRERADEVNQHLSSWLLQRNWYQSVNIVYSDFCMGNNNVPVLIQCSLDRSASTNDSSAPIGN